MQLLQFFNRKALSVVLYTVAALVMMVSVTFFYYRSIADDLDSVIARQNHIDHLNTLLSGSALVIDENLDSYAKGNSLDQYASNIADASKGADSMVYELKKHAYPPVNVEAVSSQFVTGIDTHSKFLEALRSEDSLQVVNARTGITSLEPVAGIISDGIAQYHKHERATHDESLASVLNLLFIEQIFLLIFVPLLVIGGLLFKSNRSRLIVLLKDIDESNRKYVFDSNEEYDITNEHEVKGRWLSNLRRATDFIQRIANGDYSVRWDGMDDSNRSLNQENIAGELIRMREQMKEVKEQDRVRIWSTEGLSRFGEIIRNYQNDLGELSDNLIYNIVKYVDAKVGGLYIVEDDTLEGGKVYLNLRACFAYERKKFLERRIELGEGLVGQTYLEGKTVHLKEVPENYMLITSGLGNANPKNLLIVPLKTNDKIEGVLELASLREFQDYEIEFIEKLAEALAASIVSVRSAEKNQRLLVISQEQSEEMRSQEEEMRQNMEELEATQEQMERHVSELTELRKTMEFEKQLFGALMDNIPDAVYFKDKESKFIRVSRYLAEHFRSNVNDLIGRSDYDFQDLSHAQEAFEDEKEIMKTRVPKIDYVEKETKDGIDHYVSTTKMPLLDASGAVIGTFGISRDVTKLKRLEIDIINREKKFKAEEAEYENRIRTLERRISVREEELNELRKKTS